MEEIYKVKLDSLYGAFAIMANGAYTYLTDIKHNYSRWSKEAVDYFGLPSEYMENAGDVWMENVHPDDRAVYAASIKELFGGKVSEHNLQYRARTKDGKYIVCTCRGVVIRDENGEPDYFGGTIKNNDTLSYFDDISNFRSLYGFLEDLQSAQWKGESADAACVRVDQALYQAKDGGKNRVVVL